MDEVFANHRLRGHRVEYLNTIEEAIDRAKLERTLGDNNSYWKQSENTFKQRFVTKHTWNLIRTATPMKNWYKGLWFTHATPNY